MKGKGLVVILIMCLGLLAGLHAANSAEQQMAPSSEQGFLVRIVPSGKIVSAANWDGSPIQMGDEKRRITDARLAFFEQGGEPSNYLRKVDGKWQKTMWAQEPSGMDDIAQGIIVYVAADGTIKRVTNMDGSEVQGIDFKNARIATKNTCCYGRCGIYVCCLCSYCPGGHC